MLYIADLHVHSHYSRATSKDLNLESLYQWAKIKGINVVGTGDFTHPLWFKELKEKLQPDDNGLFTLKNPPASLPGMQVQDIDVRFCLTTEISSIYKYGDKVRKNHNLVYAPDFETVEKMIARLSQIGNLASDGRPILGLPSRDLLEIVLHANENAYLIPAHVWTPWFSTLGSKGGYDSVDECFRDLTSHIFAIETGLSSDPDMNRKWSALDRFTLISNSDAHSPQKLGREANLLNTDMSYYALFNAFKTGNGFVGTYEFFPEEGKYHHDGHRNCGVSLLPEETIKHKGICPECGAPLTIGVLNRVESLADRETAQQPVAAAGFKYIIPLPEILAEINQSGTASKAVAQAFNQSVSAFGNEFSLLNEVPVEDIEKKNPILAEAIRRMRTKEVNPIAGYDGLYGIIKIFKEGELKKLSGQLHFFGDEPVQATKKRTSKKAAVQKTSEAGVVDTPVKATSLNDAQQQVKDTLSGAVLVKAGPGTGKTSTLIQWIAAQVQVEKIQPSEILAITFTNKAAREIKERLMHTLGDGVKNMRIGTFHAIGYHLLREQYAALQTVYDEESRLSVSRFLFPALKETECKKLCDALEKYFESHDESLFDNIASYAGRYREYVQKQGAVDLADILQQVIALWKNEPATLEKYRQAINVIAVDEFQDINALQYEFLQLLGAGKNILAIGDPDQAIYGFRGSDMKLFFRFADDFHAKEIPLSQNYRSTQTILQAAGSVIQHNVLKSGIQLQANKTQGTKIRFFRAGDPADEAKYIVREIEKHVGGLHLLTSGSPQHGGEYVFPDIAVLYRTHAVGRELLFQLKKSEIPIHLTDGSAFLRQQPFSLIGDIIRLYLHPQDMVALQNILQRGLQWEKQEIKTYLTDLHEKNKSWQEMDPRAGEGFMQWKEFYNQLSELIKKNGVEGVVKEIFLRYIPNDSLSEEQLLKKETLITLAKEAKDDMQQYWEENTLNSYTDTNRQQAYGIHLLTFHAAKGLEFPVVFIAGAEEGITPAVRNTDIEEERRLFYVALTRAKNELHITNAAKRLLYGKEEQQEESSFIKEIPAALMEAIKPDIKKKNTPEKENQLTLF